MGWHKKAESTSRRNVGPGHAENLVLHGGVLLDVRELAEWQAGHVPGAFHLPLGQLEGEVAVLPRDRCIVVICRSGNRSATATDLLVRSGLDAVNLDGGMQAWAAAGLPVETSDERPGKVL
ncbi:MAG TPA: rhodanese-like domain-containing protein [Acidimicrobiales bacterium]|nr:rhodanese-like domain-containing protein [Acidimicrobiales bacterium]